MLNKLSLKNFKGFEKINDFDIKPITILCGPNSSGKSSILQSLLLLRQTLESQNPNQTLLLNGRFVHLGLFSNLIFNRYTDSKIQFELNFEFYKYDNIGGTKQKRSSLSLINYLRDLLIINEKTSLKSKFSVDIKIELMSKPSTKTLVTSTFVNLFHVKVEMIDPEISIPHSEILIKNEYDELYSINWNNVPNRLANNKYISGNFKKVKIEFSNLLPRIIKSSHDDVNNARIFYGVNRFFFSLGEIIRNDFISYSYIGPLREEPARRYIYENEVIEIGNKGENAAYIYLNELIEPLKIQYYYNYETKNFEKKNFHLEEAVDYWLKNMNIYNFKPEIKNEIIYLNMNSNLFNNTRVNIADVGFGVSQIFPIVLEGLRIPDKFTLLLEQPEIHLHPNLQMNLADFFISIALSNKRVIVETHSDHIINRIVRRIVEDNYLNIKDLVRIYYINNHNVGYEVEHIKIDEENGIVNWPKEFFDQTANEQLKTLQAGFEKRKNKKLSND